MSAPLPEGPPGSRFAEVSRRAFLQRSAGLAGVAAMGGLAACSGGNNDANTFASTTAPSSSSSAPPPSTPSGPAAGSLPSGAQLAITCTYVPTAAGGRVNNPYLAVWIEDSTGALVKALAVWYKTGRDARYLSELTDWSSTQGTSSALAAVSGATRTPGDYRLQWDGTDLDGGRAPAGSYYVCIESAREHGPHSLIRQAVTHDDQPATTQLQSNGELSRATADYRTS